MTDSIDNTTQGLPPLEELAVETIRALVVEGYTSSVMKMPRPMLNELARRFVTEGYERKDTLEWLREEKGITQQQFKDYTFDRFSMRFREKLEVVKDQARDRMILMQIASDRNFSEDDYQQFLKNKTLMILARQLAASSSDEIDPSILRTAMTMVGMMDEGKIAMARLELQANQSVARVAKLEADLKLSEQQADHRERELVSKIELAEQRTEQLKRDALLKQERIEERLGQLQTRLDGFAKRAARGERITEEELKFADADLEAAREAAA